jgi:hypothetical protein
MSSPPAKPAPAAFVEPPEAKQAFAEKATEIVERAANGRMSRGRIWTDIVYAVDGARGMAGRNYSDDQIVGAIQEAAAH